MERVVRCRSRLPKEVVDDLSLQILKARLDGDPGSLISSCGRRENVFDPQNLPQLQPCILRPLPLDHTWPLQRKHVIPNGGG